MGVLAVPALNSRLLFVMVRMFYWQDAREAAAFIRPMLEMDPDKRASAQEMLDHPWLEGVGATVDEVSLSGYP